MTVGTGSTLDVQNLGTVDLASLTTAAGGSLGVIIGEPGTRSTMSRRGKLRHGDQVLVTLDHVGTAAGTYTIIDAGDADRRREPDGSIVTLPFLFNSTLTSDAATGRSRSRSS